MADRSNKITKYRRPLNLNIGMLIFATIFIYIIICVIMYFQTDHVVGYSVKEGSLTSNTIYKGIALRTEKIITSNDAGYVNYFAREGERAAFGNLVYTIDETGKLSDYIKSNESGENTLSDADLSELKTEIVSFAGSFDSHDFSDVYNFKYNVEGTVMKLANYNILENADALNGASETSLISYCYAPDSGIVIYSTDGYESLTLQGITMEHFDQDTYEKTHLVNNELIAKGDPVYKLSTSEDWSIVIPVEAEFAEQLKEEEYVKVRFLKNQYTAWGQVSVYTNDNEETFAALTFTNSMITFCTDRFVDIELILEDESGLKIPNSSIVEKEFFIVPKEYVTLGGNSGKSGVLLETYDENGNATTEFVETGIYEETETEYYLDDTVLRAGNYLLKPDSTEKYAVSKTGSLIGVYNINKGYADFKQIIILYQNEEYAIVKSNTAYGLSVYDHIVLDASTVKDNEFIYE